MFLRRAGTATRWTEIGNINMRLLHANAEPLIPPRPSNDIRENIHQRIAGRDRFYKHVGYCVAADAPGMYKVTLDGRTLKTPARNPLYLPNEELAAMVAIEWDAQLDKRRGIVPASMPTMILTSTAIDQILPDPTEARTTSLRFLPTDSALFFTTDDDRILLKKQKTHFNPLIRWANKSFGLELKPTQMIGGRIHHPDLTIKRVKYLIDQLDHFELSCLQTATMECKSVIMAIALLFRYIDYQQAKEISRIEEEFQAEIWGTVEGGHDMDRLNNSVNLSSIDSFMTVYWDQKTLDAKLDKYSKEAKLIK